MCLIVVQFIRVKRTYFHIHSHDFKAIWRLFFIYLYLFLAYFLLFHCNNFLQCSAILTLFFAFIMNTILNQILFCIQLSLLPKL